MNYILSFVIIILVPLLISSIESFSVSKVNNNNNVKKSFYDALDDHKKLNEASSDRTTFVQKLTESNPTNCPGSTKSFAPIAVGTWRVIYAPHITTLSKILLGGGRFDPILYDMRSNGKIVSHVRYEIPIIGESGWLSVSGTYGSEDEDKVCRVDFDEAWIKRNSDDDDDSPYPDINAVPPSLFKKIIQNLGRAGFIDSVSIFPVSYLDNDTIVFDFQLLGTRICARKISFSNESITNEL